MRSVYSYRLLLIASVSIHPVQYHTCCNQSKTGQIDQQGTVLPGLRQLAAGCRICHGSLGMLSSVISISGVVVSGVPGVPLSGSPPPSGISSVGISTGPSPGVPVTPGVAEGRIAGPPGISSSTTIIPGTSVPGAGVPGVPPGIAGVTAGVGAGVAGAVGAGDGVMPGAADSVGTGDAVGTGDSVTAGVAVGATVGATVGAAVGATVGVAVGAAVAVGSTAVLYTVRLTPVTEPMVTGYSFVSSTYPLGAAVSIRI